MSVTHLACIQRGFLFAIGLLNSLHVLVAYLADNLVAICSVVLRSRALTLYVVPDRLCSASASYDLLVVRQLTLDSRCPLLTTMHLAFSLVRWQPIRASCIRTTRIGSPTRPSSGSRSVSRASLFGIDLIKACSLDRQMLLSHIPSAGLFGHLYTSWSSCACWSFRKRRCRSDQSTYAKSKNCFLSLLFPTGVFTNSLP